MTERDYKNLPTLPSEAYLGGPSKLWVLACIVVGVMCMGSFVRFVVATTNRMAEIEREQAAVQEATALVPMLDTIDVTDSRHYIEDLLATDNAELQAWEAVIDDARLTRVMLAMHTLAKREPCRDCNGVDLVRRWGGKPELFAEAILKASDAYRIDPLAMVAISWRETRFDVTALGDSKEGTSILSCGPTQVRVDFPGRPSCEQLQDAEFAMNWTAKKLDGMRDEFGRIRLTGWNGGRQYEIEVSRDVSWIREHLGN